MDTIILAGGRNRRLQGVVPAYWKPLIVVNQRPLISHAVAAALEVAHTVEESNQIIIVTSPESTLPISEVVPPLCDIICKVGGPGAALLTGLRLVASDHVLILMGDNLTPVEDISKIVSKMGNVVGTGLIPVANCERFTRLRRRLRGDATPGQASWVEKIPFTDEDFAEERDEVRYARAWLGPLKLRSAEIELELKRYQNTHHTEDELPIGPVLNQLRDVSTVDVHSVDIGLPEVLP